MKTIVTTLVLIILLVGCAEKERYAERYLDSIDLVLHLNKSCEVRGFLKKRFSLEETMEYPGINGIGIISITCSREDSLDLIDYLKNSVTPITITANITDGIPYVEYSQEGISWKPEYRWSAGTGLCSFTATIILHNSTGREWFSENMVMVDVFNEPVCRVSDTLIIPEGELELGWWHAEGTAFPLRLVYGWPINAEWNQLIPCHVPQAGRLFMEDEETSDLILRTGDTLWIQPEQKIELLETIEQNPDGYSCILKVLNGTGRYIEIELSHPDILPRGAEFRERVSFPTVLKLLPGEDILLEYDIVYMVSS